MRKETDHLSAGHVKRYVAVFLHALNGRARVTLLAHAARQSTTRDRHLVDLRYRLE